MRTLGGLRSWTLVHGSAALFFTLCVSGCSGDSTPSPVDVCQPEEPTARPPAPPEAGSPGSGDNVVFAIRNLDLGYEGADGMEQDGVPQSATDGVIAGVLDTVEYVQGVHEHRSEFCVSIPEFCQYLCGETPHQAFVLRQIEAASDIMKDGSQDPTSLCHGISVGLGFEATAVKLGPAMDRQPPPLDPCTD